MRLGLGTALGVGRSVLEFVPTFAISIASPIAEETLSAGDIGVSGSVQEGAETIDRIEYKIDDGAFQSFTYSTSWSVDVEFLGHNQQYTITVRVTDVLENFVEDSVTFSVIDDIAPTPGDNGNTSVSDITDSSFIINFVKATDNNSDTDLVYTAFTGDPIALGSLETIESQVQEGQATDVSQLTVSNKNPGETVSYNVLVADPAGNKAIYEVNQVLLLDPEVDSIEVSSTTGGVTTVYDEENPIQISLGESLQLDIEVQVIDSENDAYTTSIVDTGVATIDASDIITGEGVGLTTLTVTADLDNTKVDIPVEVIDDELNHDSEIF